VERGAAGFPPVIEEDAEQRFRLLQMDSPCLLKLALPEDSHRQPFAPYRFFAEMACFTLHSSATGVMNRHAPTKRRKDSPT
jgi:hypothetical protein